MKWKCVFVNVLLYSVFTYSISAQRSFIPSLHLSITCNKTTNLIFPFSVQSIDRGSKDILVQQPAGTKNIVQVKADKPDFVQTNLSVITVDGKLYSFLVDYMPEPPQMNVVVGNQHQASVDSLTEQRIQLKTGNNEALFKATAESIEGSKVVRIKKQVHGSVQLRIDGIYINHDVLYFRLALKNKSNISYDAGEVHFSTRDKQKTRRTATQELELTPVYQTKSLGRVEADTSASCIIALPKFTLGESKFLYIRLPEDNGNRHIGLLLKSRHILKAVRID